MKNILLLLAFVTISSHLAAQVVTVDNNASLTTTGGSPAVTSFTLPFTVSANNNRFLLVCVTNTINADAPEVTFNSVSMTQLATGSRGGVRVTTYYAVLGSSGSSTTANIGATGINMKNIGAISFYNVQQSNPYDGAVSNDLSAISGETLPSTFSLTVSSRSGDMVVDCVGAGAVNGITGLTANAGQTEKANNSSAGLNVRMGMSVKPGASPNVHMGWTINGTLGTGQVVFHGVNIRSSANAPEINLTGNSNPIPNNSTPASTTNHTDFGPVNVASGTVVRTFTIENLGTSDLNLTAIPDKVTITGANGGDFSVTTQPTSPVLSSNSTTFQVTFDPSAGGLRTATVNIANNDSDENPYTFAIQGAGLEATNLSLTSGTNPSLLGNNVTFSATLTANSLPLSGESVTLTIGASNYTAVTNSSGVATFSISSLAVGSYAVTASYAGNLTQYAASTSNTVTQVVNGPDYTITTTGNVLTITDVSGNGETLAISESGSNIRFNVTGRTYSINGGATTAFTTPADVALAGLTSIVVNTATGNDIINVGAFTANLPSLTINGGTGDDQVRMNGDITFAANANLDVDLQNDDAIPGTDLVTFASNTNLILSGTGTATLKASQNVSFSSGSSLETTNGNLSIEANQQAVPTLGSFMGVRVNAATVRVNGTGTLTVKGKSGNDSVINQYGVLVQSGGLISGGTSATATIQGSVGAASANANIGVYVTETNTRITSLGGNVSVVGLGGSTGATSTCMGVSVTTNASITAGGSGTVTVSGTGGAGTGNFNTGVYVAGSANTFITSSGGNVSVTGVGGGTGSGNNNYGIWMELAGTITAGSSGTVSVSGQGGGSTGGSNVGITMANTGAQITSSGGNISVTGIEGSGAGSLGFSSFSPSGLTTATNGGNITLIANSINLTGVISTQGTGSTTLRPYTNGVQIDLGTTANTVGGPLGLSDTELDNITTGTLIIGDGNSGNLTVSAAISRSASTNLQLVSGGDVNISGGGFDTGGGTLLLDPGTSPAAVKPTFNNTDVTASTLSFASDLQIAINGTTLGNGTGSTYTQLKVVGAVNLTGVDLLFAGSYVPMGNEVFTIVENDDTDVIVGTFTGLDQGATIPDFRGSGLNATISYTGGSGNDVVITVLSPEINLKGNSINIASGETAYTNNDHRDFGSVNVTSGTVVRTFTIENTGSSNLTISGINKSGTHQADYTIGGITLPATISANSSTTFTVTFDPSAAGMRTAMVSIANDDANENPYTFSIQGTGTCNLTASAGTSTPSVCVGGIITLTASAGDSYTWAGPAGSSYSSSSQNPTAFTATSTNFSGVYTVTVSTTIGCTSTATVSVNVNANPTAGINLSSPSICAGGTINLTATGGSSYSWATSGGTFTSTTNEATFSSSSAGGFSFTVTATNTNTCSASATASVTVNANPSVNITGTNVICIGSTTSLTPTTGGTWASSSDAIATVTDAGVVTGVINGTATFRFTQISTGCVSAPTSAILVNPTPSVSATNRNQTICSGSTITTMVMSGTIANTVYNWTHDKTSEVTGIAATGSGNISGALTNTTNAPVTVTFTITPSFTNFGTTCNGTPISASILVNPTPSMTLGPIPAICAGAMSFTIPYTATTGTPTTYSISGTGFTVVTDAALPSGSIPVNLSAAASGTSIPFTLTVKNASGCTSTDITGSVTVNANPSVSLNPSSSSLCIGQSINLAASGGSGYSWAASGGTFNSSTNPATFSSSSAGGFSFTVTATNTNTCSASATASVTVGNASINVIAPSSICAGATINLTASGGSSYSWVHSGGGIFSSSTSPVTFSSSSAGGFSFTVTATVTGGCTATATTSVSVKATPSVSLNPSSSSICIGQSINLAASGGSGYSWAASGGTFNSSTNPATFSSSSAGGFSFTVTATSTNTCSASATASVTVNATPNVSLNPSSSSLCIGQSINLEASGGSGYVWAASGGTFNSSTNPATFSSSIAGGFSFTVTATNSNTCSASATASVTVNANPSVSLNPSSSSICIGQSINLEASGGSSYAWAASGGTFNSSSNPATFSSSSAGGFSFTVTATNTNTCSASATASVTVNANPSVSLNPSSSSICIGQNINLAASGGSGYSWAASGGTFNSSANPATFSSSSAGGFSFTVTATSTNTCSASATASVTVNANPNVSLNPSSSSLCIGQSINLAASGGSGYSWAASGGTFNSSTNPATFSSSSAGGFSFTVTATNSNSCSASATASVTVGNASINVIAPSSICAGATINLTASGGSSYSWVHSGGGSFSSSTSPVTFSSSSAGGFSFTVTATVTGGCTATATTSVSVKATPSVSLNPSSSSLCIGQSINLAASGGSSYSWSASGGTFNSSSNPATFSSSSAGGFSFTVTATNTNTCSASATASVTVGNASINVIAPSSICAGATINLTASGGSSYSWVHSGGGSFSSSTSPVTFSSSSAGGFSFTVTATVTGGCTATATTSVSVKANPTVGLTASSTSICAGATINLEASGGSGYSWAASGGTFNSSSNPATFSSSIAGGFSFTVTATNTNTCSASATASVTVNANPSVSLNPSSSSLCIGQNINLAASGGSGYSWAASGGTFNSSSNPATFSSSSAGGFSFTVTATNSNSCSASATASVTVNATPSVSLNPSSSSLCIGQSINLAASGGSSYSWAASGGTFNSSTNPATFSSSIAGGFSFTVTATNSNSCSASATASVTVGNASINVIAPSSICAGATINLTASGGSSYSWVHSGGGSFSSSTSPVTFSSSSAGGFSFTVTATVTGGCTATATTSVSVKATPSVSLNPSSSSICIGQNINLAASGGSGYSWAASGGTFNSSSNPATFSSSSAGGFSFTVTATNTNTCSASATASVTVNASPNVSLNPSSSSICIGQSINLEASGGSGYVWSASGGTFNSSTNPATFSSSIAGEFSFTVTATNSNSCSASATASVTVNANPNAVINPSATSICAGGTINLTASGGSSYSWSTSGGTFSSNTSNPTSWSTNNAGGYTISVTAGSGTCTATASASVTVNNSSSSTLLSFAPICALGNPLNLSVSGGSSYSWRGPNGFKSNIATPSKAKTVAKDEGIYSVTVGGTLGCTVTSTIKVYIGVGKITASSNSTVCKGGTIQLSATAEFGASYKWTKQFGSVVYNGQNPSIPNAQTSNGGVYIVFVTGVNGCIGKQETLVVVSSAPCTSGRLASGEANDLDMQVSVWENPTKGNLKVRVQLPENEAIQLVWTNQQGRNLEEWEFKEAKPEHQIELDVEHYKEGMYFLHVKSPTRHKTIKVWRMN